jgi:hypothetical protein
MVFWKNNFGMKPGDFVMGWRNRVTGSEEARSLERPSQQLVEFFSVGA